MIFAPSQLNKTGPWISGRKYMSSLRRVVNQLIDNGLQQLASVADHLHLARAYRPVSNRMIPRWRNLGTAITPYHFMRPAVIPVRQKPVQRNIR
jgi:hypothetical protein